MNDTNNDPLQRLARLLARLPGIGEKSSMRLALSIVRGPSEYAEALSGAVVAARGRLKQCDRCCDLTSQPLCNICRDARRDQSLICVVAQPQDRMAIERTGMFSGLYHTLHGVLDPLNGVGPAELRVDALLKRLHSSSSRSSSTSEATGRGFEQAKTSTEIKELIIATSPNVEGDATAIYLAKLIGPLGVKVTRIASGVAVGGELEYADMTTLHRALEDRRPL